MEAALTVAGDHRLQDQAPALGAMDVAGPEPTTLQVAKLVEQDSGSVTGDLLPLRSLG